MKNLRKSRRLALAGKNASSILKRSSLFHELTKERDEIEKLKWIESEKTGKDIGFQKALLIWAHNHRHLWRQARMLRRKPGGRFFTSN